MLLFSVHFAETSNSNIPKNLLPCFALLNAKQGSKFIITYFSTLCVELEGIEPSSKRGNHKLSTCLSLPKFSCRNRTKAINSCLIL